MNKHTPTPWEKPDKWQWADLIRVLVAEDEIGDKEYGKGEINAEFIVRAVNSHEELIAAAKEVLENRVTYDINDGCHFARLRAYELLEKAIKQAEGGTL